LEVLLLNVYENPEEDRYIKEQHILAAKQSYSLFFSVTFDRVFVLSPKRYSCNLRALCCKREFDATFLDTLNQILRIRTTQKENLPVAILFLFTQLLYSL